jgi:hypothetical protein
MQPGLCWMPCYLQCAAAINHKDNTQLDVTFNDPTHGNVLLTDVFANSDTWIEDRYRTLEERWVHPGTGQDEAYRDASQAGMTAEPSTGWLPGPALKAWRNNVGPTTAKDPEHSLLPDKNTAKYNDETDATRRTAYWYNMERKWEMCKCVSFAQCLPLDSSTAACMQRGTSSPSV